MKSYRSCCWRRHRDRLLRRGRHFEVTLFEVPERRRMWHHAYGRHLYQLSATSNIKYGKLSLSTDNCSSLSYPSFYVWFYKSPVEESICAEVVNIGMLIVNIRSIDIVQLNQQWASEGIGVCSCMNQNITFQMFPRCRLRCGISRYLCKNSINSRVATMVNERPLAGHVPHPLQLGWVGLYSKNE